MERRPHHSVAELLQQDQYTPEEVAELLEIGLDVVRHAAFSGELRARDRRARHHQHPPRRRPGLGARARGAGRHTPLRRTPTG